MYRLQTFVTIIENKAIRYDCGVSSVATKHSIIRRADPNEVTTIFTKTALASQNDPKKIDPWPISLDLDGDGIEITELSKSTVFTDTSGDGLDHRTAWAGAGDGVLFIDADGNGQLSNSHEYVFTEWADGAKDDLDGLRRAFDSNGDGKLTIADARKFAIAIERNSNKRSSLRNWRPTAFEVRT